MFVYVVYSNTAASTEVIEIYHPKGVHQWKMTRQALRYASLYQETTTAVSFRPVPVWHFFQLLYSTQEASLRDFEGSIHPGAVINL